MIVLWIARICIVTCCFVKVHLDNVFSIYRCWSDRPSLHHGSLTFDSFLRVSSVSIEVKLVVLPVHRRHRDRAMARKRSLLLRHALRQWSRILVASKLHMLVLATTLCLQWVLRLLLGHHLR